MPNGSDEFRLLVMETFGALNVFRAYSRNWRWLRQMSSANIQKSEAQANVKFG